MGICTENFISLRTILDTNSENIKVERKTTGEPQFWVLHFPLRTGHERKRLTVEIGKIKHVRRSLRLTKETTWWLNARQDEEGIFLPGDQDTLLLLAMIEIRTERNTKHVQYICFVPLVNNEIVATLRGDDEMILGHFEHESNTWGYGQVLVSMGSKPIELMKRTLAYQQSFHPKPHDLLFDDYEDKSDELYAGKLTYCTWNSLQPPTPTTATSMIKTLQSFPIIPNNLLIDDGWQVTDDRKMADWGAHQGWLDGYDDLGKVISKVKSLGVERVGVWHAVLGYWNGVSKNSDKFKDMPFVTLTKDWGARYEIIHPTYVNKFFDEWYARLASWGVDFLKCDDMAEIEDMDSCFDENDESFPLRFVRKAYVEAIKRNVNKHFSGRIIWCMSHSPRHLLGPHALSSSSLIKPMRASNDYFPDIPNSHAYHVYTNLMASQFLSCFTIADFDMFQTHPSINNSGAPKQGAFHASLRALGNGPVTITDVRERCNRDIFMRLCGRTRDGKTVALNAKDPIEILDERCFDWVNEVGDGKGIRGYSRSVWGVCIGIWNVRESHGWVRDSVSLDDTVAVLASDEIVYWSHLKKEVIQMKMDPKEVVLGELEFDVLTLVELTSDIVCLGLVDKYNTLAAIESRCGNTWEFKCLGEAVWVIKGDRRAVVKVEGKSISTLRYKVDDLTVLRASLTDFKEKETSWKSSWTVDVSII